MNISDELIERVKKEGRVKLSIHADLVTRKEAERQWRADYRIFNKSTGHKFTPYDFSKYPYWLSGASILQGVNGIQDILKIKRVHAPEGLKA
jgi:hypothetical protein